MLAKRRKAFFRHSHRQTYHWKRFFLALLLVVIIGLSIYALFFSSLLVVEKIEIKGAESINQEEIKAKVAEVIAGKRWGFIPKDRIFSFSKNRMKSEIAHQWKRFNYIEIKRILPDKIIVEVLERQNAFLIKNGEATFLVDKQGIAFQKIESYETYDVPTISFGSQAPFEEGEKAIDENSQKYMEEIVHLSDIELGWKVAGIETPTLASGDIRFIFSNGVKIFCNTQIDPEKEISMANLIVKEKITPEKIECTDYIDVRTDNRVYYKLKCQETIKNTETEKNEKSEKKKD